MLQMRKAYDALTLAVTPTQYITVLSIFISMKRRWLSFDRQCYDFRNE